MTLRADSLYGFVVLWRVAEEVVVFVASVGPSVVAVAARHLVRIGQDPDVDEVVDAASCLQPVVISGGDIAAARSGRVAPFVPVLGALASARPAQCREAVGSVAVAAEGRAWLPAASPAPLLAELEVGCVLLVGTSDPGGGGLRCAIR